MPNMINILKYLVIAACYPKLENLPNSLSVAARYETILDLPKDQG